MIWAVDKNLLPLSSASCPGRLMRCIRCPVAYHTGDSCVAAGSVVLTHHIMICSSHGSAKRNGLLSSPVNVGWCFLCARGKLSHLYTLTSFLSHSHEPSVALNRRSRQMWATHDHFWYHWLISVLWQTTRSAVLTSTSHWRFNKTWPSSMTVVFFFWSKTMLLQTELNIKYLNLV